MVRQLKKGSTLEQAFAFWCHPVFDNQINNNNNNNNNNKGLIIRCLSGAYGLRLGEQNDSRYPRNALSRTAPHKSTEWVRKI